MNWLDIDFVKCDKTENKTLVVKLEPHGGNSSFHEDYDVKLLHYTHPKEIIFSKDYYDGVIVVPSSGAFVFRKTAYIKTLYIDLETLFTADNIMFDFPSNEDIIMHYQADVILVSQIEHKAFRLTHNQWIMAASFQSYIGAIVYLYKHNEPWFSRITLDPCTPLSKEVEEVVKLQAEILSNFSEEEIKAMNMETNPLYFPIAMEFICHNFDKFTELISLTNNKETLNRLLTDERSANELSGEAKAIIIKRMAELDDERSFEL